MPRLQLRSLVDDPHSPFESEEDLEAFVAGVITGEMLKDGANFEGLNEEVLETLRKQPGSESALRGLDELIDEKIDEMKNEYDEDGSVYDPIDLEH